jgi:hypothetical protein
MTNRGQRDDVGFLVEDEIDLLFLRGNPNPTREGCPPRDALRALARRPGSIHDPAYGHLAGCSPCFREFRAWQQIDAARRATRHRRRRLIVAVAILLSLALAIAWGIWGRGR